MILKPLGAKMQKVATTARDNIIIVNLCFVKLVQLFIIESLWNKLHFIFVFNIRFHSAMYNNSQMPCECSFILTSMSSC